MSTGNDNPILLNQACESSDACPPPDVLQAALPEAAVPPNVPQIVEEKVPEPPAANAPTRPKKAALLTEIARLSLEGHSNRAIGRKLGVPSRTVDRWVGQLRQQWAENFPQNYVELHALAVARLETAYREAMEAWRARCKKSKSRSKRWAAAATKRPKGRCGRRPSPDRPPCSARPSTPRSKSPSSTPSTCTPRSKPVKPRGAVRSAELVKELNRIPSRTFREVRQLLQKPETCRGPNELAGVLSKLPAEEYRQLYEYMSKNSGRSLPSPERRREARDEGTRMRDEG